MRSSADSIAAEFVDALRRFGGSNHLQQSLSSRLPHSIAESPQYDATVDWSRQELANDPAGRDEARAMPAPRNIARRSEFQGDMSVVHSPRELRLDAAQRWLSEIVSQTPQNLLHPTLFDGMIRGWGDVWRSCDSIDDRAEQASLDFRVAEARSQVSESTQNLEIVSARLRIARAELEAANNWQGEDGPRRRQPRAELESAGEVDVDRGLIRPDSVIRGSRLEVGIAWTFLAISVITEIVAFLPIISLLMQSGDTFGLLVAAGVALAGVGTAFQVGAALKRSRMNDRQSGRNLLRVNAAAWLTLLIVALFTSFQGPDLGASVGIATTGSDLWERLAGALMFGALYLVSGALALTAAHLAYNPAEWSIVRASRNLERQQNNFINATVLRERRLSELELLQQERMRLHDKHEVQVQLTEAQVHAALQFARVALIVHAESGQPPSTSPA